MEDKSPKFSIQLNLFDCLILLAVIAVAALLVWRALSPSAGETVETEETVYPITYTIQLQRCLAGTGALIHEGDTLTDTIQNRELGTVTAVEVGPAATLTLDQEDQVYRMAQVEGYEDILITLEYSASRTDKQVTLSSNYGLRVGNTAYVRGPGYMGSGPITSIQRFGDESAEQ